MKNVIVGTAGHVDHGKTLLIKALTGTDTDRLKEEKKRGITIELGFTNMLNEENINIGIIDVPGHEKFVKNMLAGIGSIDIALLVISAEDGVMPQTEEHFQIISKLNISKGIIVLTKSDLVDEEWLEVVKEDAKALVKGSFLENAEMIEVSSHTGHNIELLKAKICKVAQDIELRNEDSSLLRIPVDRVFSISGFGTVITGTLIEGSCKLGEEIEIYPEGKRAKIRNIQVHGKDTDQAFAGQRTAINLANIKKEEIKRGDVVAAQKSLKQTHMLDVKVSLFEKTNRAIINGARLHLYYGSAEVLCKAVLLDAEALNRGESGYVQFRLEREIAVKMGDRFIISFYSPVETIGGGVIIDANPLKHKRYDEKTLNALRIKESGSAEELLVQKILESSKEVQPLAKILNEIGKLDTDRTIKEKVEEFLGDGTFVNLNSEVIVHRDYIELAGEKSKKILNEYHQKNPLLQGMIKEEFRKRLVLLIGLQNDKFIDEIILRLQENNMISESDAIIALPDFEVAYTDAQNQIRVEVMKQYDKGKFSFPEVAEISKKYKDKNLIKQIIENLAREGKLVKLYNKEFIASDIWNEAIEILDKKIKEKGNMSLAEFRDEIEASRKYAMAILETFDDKKITIMDGDVRVKL